MFIFMRKKILNDACSISLKILLLSMPSRRYAKKLQYDLQNLNLLVFQHSTPAMELQRPFFPTFNSKESLRHFHRPLLKRVTNGKLAAPGPHPVSGLLKHIKKKAKVKSGEVL